eukprot:TRINITY_DN12403_c0_g1_i1.p1 TRINITY_DN12403_c0_g1~~TRINITY_DN12403_c0_g1_i1.p1  ORF type:complete len:122 (-),score=18.46 TRINITY_DN12403_c0_g1_i1:73-438(-)
MCIRDSQRRVRGSVMGDVVEEEKKVEILSGGDPTCITAVLRDESHTLGNSLRFVLLKNPDIEFAGYSIPHPSDNKLNIRVQTRKTPAVESFRKGLQDLVNICEHVQTTFRTEISMHDAMES